jgi:hypothetical protein
MKWNPLVCIFHKDIIKGHKVRQKVPQVSHHYPPQTPAGVGLQSGLFNGADCLEFEGRRKEEAQEKERISSRDSKNRWKMRFGTIWHVKIWFLICTTLLLHTPVWASANIRAIEKRILDSIIGDGRYDSRIRPLGVNNTGTVGKSMNKFMSLSTKFVIFLSYPH